MVSRYRPRFRVARCLPERSPVHGGEGRGGGSSVAGLARATGGKAVSRESRAGQDAVVDGVPFAWSKSAPGTRVGRFAGLNERPALSCGTRFSAMQSLSPVPSVVLWGIVARRFPGVGANRCDLLRFGLIRCLV